MNFSSDIFFAIDKLILSWSKQGNDETTCNERILARLELEKLIEDLHNSKNPV